LLVAISSSTLQGTCSHRGKIIASHRGRSPRCDARRCPATAGSACYRTARVNGAGSRPCRMQAGVGQFSSFLRISGSLPQLRHPGAPRPDSTCAIKIESQIVEPEGCVARLICGREGNPSG
jgi:hypothetical protein